MGRCRRQPDQTHGQEMTRDAIGHAGENSRASRYSAPALEKGLDIIELLSGTRAALSLGQIAERLGRSKSEIFRMVNVLESRGYIARGENGDNFAVTNKLFELGMRHPPTRMLVEAALPVMAELARSLGQSCHLAVASREHNVVIARAECPGEESFAVSLGYRRNLADSTSGRVLLAFQSPAQREVMLGAVRRHRPARYDEARLLVELERIRARGYELAGSRSIVGITDVGAPVLDSLGAAVACLTVPFINRVDRPNDLPGAADAVLEAVRRISDALY